MSERKVIRFPGTPPSGDTWQVAYVRSPGWVDEDGDFYRPWLALAASAATGLIGASDLTRCDKPYVELALEAFDSLHESSGTRPALIEVADLELAEELPRLLQEPGCTVSCRGDLPLLTDVIRSMYRDLTQNEPYEAATRVPGVTIDHLRAFADAAQEFRLAEPWRHLESEDIIEVGAPRPSPTVRYASVLGALGECGLGFSDDRALLDSDADDERTGFERLADASLWSVTFCEPWEIPVLEHEAWQQHGLATDDEGRIPSAIQYGPKRRVRRASPKMLAFFEGCFRAIALATEDELDSGRWRKVVDTSQGPLELELSLPDLLAPPEPPERGPMQLDPLRRAALMDSISKLLQGQDFDSVEEMEAFLEREIVGREPPPPKIEGPQDEARELALEALDYQGRRSIAMARKALALDPDCAHAHLVLADRAHDTETAINHYRDAIAAAERTLGPEIFVEEAGFFWAISETRPYMQAVKGLADTLVWRGEIDEAAELYTELLRLNPNDNQGVRDILAPVLMLLGDNTATQRLLDEYSKDVTASPAFNAALVAFRRRGDTKVARKRLARALKRNTHIAPLLLGRTEMPDELPSGYTLGSVEEATYYFTCAALAWANSFGALDWLAAVVDEDWP